jgi:hypothetical protein
MVKTTAMAAVVLGLGAWAMTLFGTVLGSGAEAAALGLSGAGLWAASYGLGSRLGARAGQGAQAGAQQ